MGMLITLCYWVLVIVLVRKFHSFLLWDSFLKRSKIKVWNSLILEHISLGLELMEWGIAIGTGIKYELVIENYGVIFA